MIPDAMRASATPAAASTRTPPTASQIHNRLFFFDVATGPTSRGLTKPQPFRQKRVKMQIHGIRPKDQTVTALRRHPWKAIACRPDWMAAI